MIPGRILGSALQVGDLGSLGPAFWIPTIIAIIGIPIGVLAALYFYRKSRRVKLLAYAVTTANIIQDYSGRIPDLKIEYKGKNPHTISVSKIVVWNDGTETIERNDIADALPLRINMSAGEILDASIVSVTEGGKANRFTVTKDSPLLVSPSFDYLDKNEGAIIQLVHTGRPADDIFLTGRIKGSGSPVRRKFGPHPTLNRIENWLILASLVGLLAPLLVNAFFPLSFLTISAATLSVTLLASALLVGYIAQRKGPVPKRFASAQKVP